MRVLPLALIAALLAPAAASAQSTAQRMLDTAKQIRAAAQSLPPGDRAGLIKQAEEMEAAVRAGTYGALDAAPPAAPKEASLADQLMAKYGRLDWLTPLAACAGYTQENYSTFRYAAAINDRDSHCRNAYGHYARYLQVMRNGEGQEEAEKALFYYDAAARRALALVGN